MLRSMFQIYVKGSNEAVLFYQKAFNAEVVSEYKNEDGTYLHAELNIYGQIMAVGEPLSHIGKAVVGNTMQFSLHFGAGNEEIVKKAYEVLKEDAQIDSPIGEVFFSPLMFSLIDKFGVFWCVFI